MNRKMNLLKLACMLSILILQGCHHNKPNDSIKEESYSTKSSDVDVNDSIMLEKEADKKKIQQDTNVDYSCEECLKLIETLVRTSEYDSFFKDKYGKEYEVLVDEATKQKVTIQIVINNDVPMGWMELNLDKKTLYDVTNDPENPKKVELNIKLINDFKENCLKCCLD